MGDQVPGRLRLRAAGCSCGFVHRPRRLTAGAPGRVTLVSADPDYASWGAARRGAVAGRVGRSCWGTPKHVRPEHLWRWTRPTTTCRRAGSWCWARWRSVTRAAMYESVATVGRRRGRW